MRVPLPVGAGPRVSLYITDCFFMKTRDNTEASRGEVASFRPGSNLNHEGCDSHDQG